MNKPIRTWNPGLGGTGEARMVSMSYGQLPSREQFDTHYRAAVGTGNYEMELVGEDARVASDHWGSPDGLVGAFHNKAGYSLSPDELWQFLESLIEAWSEGDDAAGDLASGILSTLNFEWI